VLHTIKIMCHTALVLQTLVSHYVTLKLPPTCHRPYWNDSRFWILASSFQVNGEWRVEIGHDNIHVFVALHHCSWHNYDSWLNRKKKKKSGPSTEDVEDGSGSECTEILGAVAKLWKGTVSCGMSDCLSVHPSVLVEQLGSHWTNFHEVWCLNIFRQCPG